STVYRDTGAPQAYDPRVPHPPIAVVVVRGVTAFVRLGGLAFTERAEGLAALAVGVVGAIEIGAARAVGLGVVGREARAGGRHPPAVAPGGVGGRTLQPVGASEALRLRIALVGFAVARVAAAGVREGGCGHNEAEGGGGDQRGSHAVIVLEAWDACRLIDIRPRCALSRPAHAENGEHGLGK